MSAVRLAQQRSQTARETDHPLRGYLFQRAHRIALAAILIVAAFLRLWHLDFHSLWEDELLTPMIAENFFTQGLRCFWRDGALNFSFFHYWMPLFGESDLSLRIPSAIWSWLTVWVIYLLGKEVHSRGAGLLGAFLAATSWFHVYYAQEVRHWAIFMLTTTSMWLFLLRMVRRPKARNALGFVLAAALAAYSSYTFRFALVTIVLATIATAGFAGMGAGAAQPQAGPVKRFLLSNGRRWVYLVVSLLLIGLLTFPNFWPDYDKFFGFPKLPEKFSRDVILDDYTRTSAGEGVRKSFLNKSYLLGVYDLWGLGFYRERVSRDFVLVFVLALLGVIAVARRRPHAAVVLFLGLAAPPVILSLVPFAHYFHARYVSAGISGYYLFIAAGVLALLNFTKDRLGVRWGPRASIAALVVLLAAWGVLTRRPLQHYYTTNIKGISWRDLMQAMMDDARPADRFVQVRYIDPLALRHYVLKLSSLKVATAAGLKNPQTDRRYYFVAAKGDSVYSAFEPVSPKLVFQDRMSALWRFEEPVSVWPAPFPNAGFEATGNPLAGWVVSALWPNHEVSVGADHPFEGNRYAALSVVREGTESFSRLSARLDSHGRAGLASISVQMRGSYAAHNILFSVGPTGDGQPGLLGTAWQFTGLGTIDGQWREMGRVFFLNPGTKYIDVLLGQYSDYPGTRTDFDFVMVRLP